MQAIQYKRVPRITLLLEHFPRFKSIFLKIIHKLKSKIRGNMNTQGTYNNGKLLIVQPSAAKPITTSTTNFVLCVSTNQ